jgi:hypothetical protein
LLEARWRSFGFRVGRAIVFSSIGTQKLLVVVVVIFRCDIGRWRQPAGQPFRGIRYATLAFPKGILDIALEMEISPCKQGDIRQKKLTLLLLSDEPEPPSSALRFVP